MDGVLGYIYAIYNSGNASSDDDSVQYYFSGSEMEDDTDFEQDSSDSDDPDTSHPMKKRIRLLN